MRRAVCEVATALTSAVGIACVIEETWKAVEIAEIGRAVVTSADTFVALILTLIIWGAITYGRWHCD